MLRMVTKDEHNLCTLRKATAWFNELNALFASTSNTAPLSAL